MNDSVASMTLNSLDECARIQKLAEDEASFNRREAEAVYDCAARIGGELRYELLWRATELERLCRLIDWCASAVASAPPEEAPDLRLRLSEHLLRAAELRHEIMLMKNATHRSSSRQGYATASRSRRHRSVTTRASALQGSR